MTYTNLPKHKKVFIFELDDVLYPQKDYVLQVYYLFANFLEYQEGIVFTQDMIDFMAKRYAEHGERDMFDKLKEVFAIDEKYRGNFERLYVNARLPIKLLLFDKMATLLNDIISDKKQLFILTKGNPDMQINKIKQTDWGGLEKQLRVYFTDIPDSTTPSLLQIKNTGGFQWDEILLIGNAPVDKQFAEAQKVDFMAVDELL